MKILGRIVGLAAFAAFYLKLVLQANLRIAADVITPGLRIRPAFLKIPLRTRGDYDLLLLSNLISMTPGTLSFDVSPDRNFLYVHVMYADDPERERRWLGKTLQSKVLALTGGGKK